MLLPPLREELELLPGPPLADGQPSWTLHDPARNLFFRIDWPSFEILQRWSFDDPADIVGHVGDTTTLQLETDDVQALARFLVERELVRTPPGTAPVLAARRARQAGSPLRWLLHHYLFFRVPLWRPDAWLGRWQPVADRLQSRGFLLLTLLALLIGAGEVVRQWDGFSRSLTDHLTPAGMLSVGVALFFVKWLHELGHAFTAKRMGCHVPTMGVAFLVMWPVAYTDTNDSWRLRQRGQRLRIAAAGIVTELAVAAWATLAWALLPDGAPRNAAFVLATTSWIGTLAINASPFMRFDGYFILSDGMDLPNLHERSFALARWWLREKLFALGDDKPEHFSRGRERFLIGFAVFTWLYRLTVFFGIALLVYHKFFKLLGMALFAVELLWFIALPLAAEARVWFQRRDEIRARPRARRSALLAAAALSLLLLPWPARITASALLRPVQVWPVYAPAAARLLTMPTADGDHVAAGQTLFTLEDPALLARRADVQARLARARWQAGTAGFDAESRNRLRSSEDALATASAELATVDAELARDAITAPFAGTLRDVDPELAPGVWVRDKEALGLLVGDGDLLVETWLDETAVKQIAVGDHARFTLDGGDGGSLSLRVRAIDADATRVLKDARLSAATGGHLLVRESHGQLIPEYGVYHVTLSVDSVPEALRAQSWRGSLVLHGAWGVPAWRYLRNGIAILIREVGF